MFLIHMHIKFIRYLSDQHVKFNHKKERVKKHLIKIIFDVDT